MAIEDYLQRLAAEVVADYQHLLSAEERRELIEQLEDALATHPETASLLEQLAPRAAVNVSGKVSKDGDSSDDATGSAGDHDLAAGGQS